MARGKLDRTAFRRGSGDLLYLAPYRQVRVYNHDTETLATGYTLQTGGVAITYPLVADRNGRYSAWFESGMYDLDDGSRGARIVWTADDGVEAAGGGGAESAEVAVMKEAPLNVRWPEFGASGRNVGDDTPKIQAAIDKVAAQTGVMGTLGGEIYIPPGSYIVNGQLNIPGGISLRIFGGGVGTGFGIGSPERGKITTLIRTTAYADTSKVMIKGDGSVGRIALTLEKMVLDGKFGAGITNAAELLYIRKSNALTLRDLLFVDHSDTGLRPSVKLANAFNATVDNCWFHNLGYNTTPNAAGLHGNGAGLAIVEGTVTLKVSNCEWEGNLGTDIYIGHPSAVSGVTFSNIKMERGQTNTTAAWPYIWLGNCQAISFDNLALSHFRQVAAIKQTGVSSVPNQFSNLMLTRPAASSGYATGNYFVEVDAGSMMFMNTYVSDPAPGIAYFKVAAAVGDFKFLGMVDNPAILKNDLRAGANTRWVTSP